MLGVEYEKEDEERNENERKVYAGERKMKDEDYYETD